LSFTLDFIQKEKFLKTLRDRPRTLFFNIKKRWTILGGELIKEIVREQLSGRRGKKGLNRGRGNAARALNVSTKQTAKDITQKLFLVKSNRASKYLPYHDESRKWDGIIRPKKKKALAFKVHKSTRIFSKKGKRLKKAQRQYDKVVVKKVFLPVRTSILSVYLKKTKPKLFEAIQDAVAEMMRG